jgi:dihydrodipicolinate synthase/N-acetylneuraminate lyase
MKKQKKPLRGILPALCTTFGMDGALDLDAQREAVRFVLASGANGIVCFGLAGEVNKLTPDERKQLSSVIIAEVDGRVPVLVGVGAESLYTARDLAKYVESAGADGVVVPPPITSHCDESGLAPYFAAIADSTSLPMTIQDAPAYLGMKLSAAGIRSLAEAHPNIKYVKIESGPEETARWVADLSPAVEVLTGNAGMFLIDDIHLGAVGNVPGTELTDVLVSVYRDETQGRGQAARQNFNRLLPYLMFSLQGIDHYNACTKEVMVRRGILKRAGLRSPAPALDGVAMGMLDRLASEMGLTPYASMARAAAAQPAE